MMKTKIFSIVLLAFSTTFSSCSDFLEQPADVAGMTPEVVFSTIENAEKVLAAAYSTPPWGFPTLQGGGAWSYGIMNYFAPIASLCDEGDVGCIGEAYLHAQYHLGQLTPSQVFPFTEDKWDMNWQCIRSAWMFYDNVDQVSDGTSKDYINQRKCEALGMIATKYYEMFKRYAGIPWIDRYLKVGDTAPKARLTVAQTVDSICSLIDRAMVYLPERNGAGEFGRINKMAMRVLKSRVLLWAASPLYNPTDNQSYYPSFGVQNLLKYDNYDKERWNTAAKAAKEAIDAGVAAGYDLYKDPAKTPRENYKLAFTAFPNIDKAGAAKGNKEIIWGTRLYPSYNEGQGSERCRIFSRANFGKGTPYCIPLQNFVELYELQDGSVQSANFFAQKDPYSKLDARFAATIIYHNKKVGSYTMDMSQGGDQDAAGQGQQFSGYYLSKCFDDKWITGENPGSPDAYWPYMRFAELYLNYAEALCEYNYSANKGEILKYINYIRVRAGQPELEKCPGYRDDYKYVLDRIKNERAIELAYEEHRYFDLKRWREGDKIGGEVYGIKVTGTADSPVFTKTLFETRTFTDKWYQYPFLENDVNKCSGELLQNPGW